MAFFSYPPNASSSPLFDTLTVTGQTTGSGVFGTGLSVQGSAYSFEVNLVSGAGSPRALGARAIASGNTPQTQTMSGGWFEHRRTLMSTSVTDSYQSAAVTSRRPSINFTATGLGATYTNNASSRVCGLLVEAGEALNGTGNTISIPNTAYSGIFIANDSVPITGRKAGIYFDALTGGTLGSAQICDNLNFSGNWFINSTSSSPSLFTGLIGLGGTTTTTSQVVIRNGVLATTTQIGLDVQLVGSSAATVGIEGVRTRANTAAASFTAGYITQFHANSSSAAGAGSTITRHTNYYGDTPTSGVSNCFATDNLSWVGNFVFNFSSNRPSLFTGAIAHARADIASATTITALASTNGFVRLTGVTATTIQGITAGVDGQVLRLYNATGQNMTIANENAGATAANRITTMTGADVATTGNGFAEFIYDTGAARWICMYVTA